MKIELSKEARDAGYALKGNVPYAEADFGKFGFVNFAELTPDRCQKLINKGFAYLEKVESKAAKAASDEQLPAAKK